eukprot:SAG31_NODE_5516_length_2483_cov_6.085151_2_plen_183_part_00
MFSWWRLSAYAREAGHWHKIAGAGNDNEFASESVAEVVATAAAANKFARALKKKNHRSQSRRALPTMPISADGAGEEMAKEVLLAAKIAGAKGEAAFVQFCVDAVQRAGMFPAVSKVVERLRLNLHSEAQLLLAEQDARERANLPRSAGLIACLDSFTHTQRSCHGCHPRADGNKIVDEVRS